MNENNMKTFDIIATILVTIGALNWGFIGIFDVDIVASVFGSMSAVSRIVYTVVGLSGLYYATQWKGITQRWNSNTRATNK